MNVLSEDKRQQVLALGRLGWSLRRIEDAVGVRRETASAYLRAARIPIRGPHGRKPRAEWPSKPASSGGVFTDSGAAEPATGHESVTASPPRPASSGEVFTDPGRPPSLSSSPNASTCEPFRELIEEALTRGRNAMAIWQDLVDDHGFRAGYQSVRRFVVKLRGSTPLEARVVITTAPGEEAQVDYGEGPMVREAASGSTSGRGCSC